MLHFNCSKLSNLCKSDPCARIEYDISESELALELRPKVLTSTLRVWRTLHTEGLYPYLIKRLQHLNLQTFVTGWNCAVGLLLTRL